MTYSEFLTTFTKQYKLIQTAQCIFNGMDDEEWVQIKQSEGFAIRELAFSLYPEYKGKIRDVCTDIRILTKKQHSLS